MIKLRFCLLSLRFIRTFFVFVVFQFAFLRFSAFSVMRISFPFFIIVNACNSSGIFFFCIPGPFPTAFGKVLCFLLLITFRIFFHAFSISHPHCIHIMITCNCFAFRSGQLPSKRTHPHSDNACPSWTMPHSDTAFPKWTAAQLDTMPTPFGQTP